MAKSAKVKLKLVSSANTGYFYITEKNPHNLPEKMQIRKYDPVVRKHVLFNEEKLR